MNRFHWIFAGLVALAFVALFAAGGLYAVTMLEKLDRLAEERRQCVRHATSAFTLKKCGHL